MESELMTPERVRALLDDADCEPGWAVHRVPCPWGMGRAQIVRAPSGAPDDGGDIIASEVGGRDAALIAAAPDLARAYLAEHERADLWRGVWSGSHDSHVRTVDEARAEIAALRERAERAEAEAARLADELAGEVLAYQASETAQTHQRERAERAETDAAKLREVVDAARAVSQALKKYAVRVSAGLACAWVGLDAALARLDGGGR